jgi:hypothetical protein
LCCGWAENVLRAFAGGSAADRDPAHDNLGAVREYRGDPAGDPASLQ